MRARAVTPSSLVAEVSEHLLAAAPRPATPSATATPSGAVPDAGAAGSWLRVAVDGPPAADPGALADALVEPLRVAGRPTLRVRTEDFLRPASLRLEFGRTNPDAYYEGWLDEAGLRREVLEPVRPGGSGRVLPSLWNAGTDRASRAGYVTLGAGGVVLVSGALLLGGGLPFDVTVYLAVSAAALRRRTPPQWHWTLPAFARYAAEVAPDTFADIVVRLDDPRHPAIVERAGGELG